MNIKSLFKREAAASQVEKTSTAGGKTAFDIKRFFKSKPPVQKSAVPSDRPPRPERTKLILIILLLVWLLASGAAYWLLPEVANPVNELLGITEVRPVPAPPPPRRTPVTPVPDMAMINAASVVVAVSAVSAISGVSEVLAISGVINAPVSSIMPVAASAVVVSQVPEAIIAMPDMPDLPAVASGVEDSPPPRRASPPIRPRNRDIRHCLELKTNEAIRGCAYPKR